MGKKVERQSKKKEETKKIDEPVEDVKPKGRKGK